MADGVGVVEDRDAQIEELKAALEQSQQWQVSLEESLQQQFLLAHDQSMQEMEAEKQVCCVARRAVIDRSMRRPSLRKAALFFFSRAFALRTC